MKTQRAGRRTAADGRQRAGECKQVPGARRQAEHVKMSVATAAKEEGLWWLSSIARWLEGGQGASAQWHRPRQAQWQGRGGWSTGGTSEPAAAAVAAAGLLSSASMQDTAGKAAPRRARKAVKATQPTQQPDKQCSARAASAPRRWWGRGQRMSPPSTQSIMIDAARS